MVSFGLMFRPGQFPFAHVLGCLKVAEDQGFDHAWFGDSHLIWHEVPQGGDALDGADDRRGEAASRKALGGLALHSIDIGEVERLIGDRGREPLQTALLESDT